MIAFPHAVFGAVTGSKSKNIVDAVQRGVASHFLLDRIPHKDYQLAERKILAADAAATVAGLYLANKVGKKALVGAIAGVAPDVVMVLEQKFDVEITLPYHINNHTQTEVPLWAGIASQVVVGAWSTAALALAARKNSSQE